MALRNGQRSLHVEHLGEVTLVRFRRSEILDEGVIEDIGNELFKLVQQERRRRLLLNLGNVDRLSTAMIGKFVAAQKKAQAETGQLALCNIDAGIYQVLELLKLTDVFKIYEDEQKGLEAMDPQRG